MSLLLYEGKRLRSIAETKALGIDPYLPSPNLIKAVQLALILQRPLLVKGEPGCGKSRLAEAIAAELFGVDLQKGDEFRKYYFEWNIKSTSKAQDGLYVIDNLQRLSDANVRRDSNAHFWPRKSAHSKTSDLPDLAIRLPKDPVTGIFLSKGNYIELGILGQAFLKSWEPGLKIPPVVLIDEIDKADIDFPNDLLLELDRMKFDIPEVRDDQGRPIVIEANKDLRPLFIITSNDEKALPPAFLRRCLFHYIEFSEINFKEIVEARFPDLKEVPGLTDKAVDAFKAWRKRIADKGTGNINISTSELLDWVKLIDHYRRLETINTSFKEDELPLYHQALLKDAEMIRLFVRKNDPAAVGEAAGGAPGSAPELPARELPAL